MTVLNQTITKMEEPKEPNEITYAAMDASEKGKDMYGPFDTVAELMDLLNAEKE